MSRALITESYLTSIANAIRAKLGVQDSYTPPQMAAAIESIPTGGITPTGTLNISENGTYDVTQYASASVSVSGGGGGGATILHGSNTPNANIGSDGNIYLLTKTLLQPLVSSQGELSVVVTANTNWSGYEPWKAFTENSGWIGQGGNPHWLQVEFSANTILTDLDFRSFDNNRSHAVSRIGYSDDGNSFTDLNLAESTIVNNIGHVAISNPVQAKYYRLYFDGAYDISSYPMVGRLELYGAGDTIGSAYLKVSGTWQNLIGSDINDVGGVSV